MARRSIFRLLTILQMLEQNIRIFVYGTLKNGESHYNYLNDMDNGYASFVCTAKTVDKYPLVLATRYNMPYLLNKPGRGFRVNGEIYEIDAHMQFNLDTLKEYPDHYGRAQLKVVTKENEIVDCWTYVLDNFPIEFLSKRCLKSYSSKEHPFRERYSECVGASISEETASSSDNRQVSI